MKNFFDFEMCFYIVVIVVSIVFIAWGNKNTKTRCEKAGGGN